MAWKRTERVCGPSVRMLDATVASVEDARRFVRTKRRAFSVALYSRSENNWRVVLSDASEGTIFIHGILLLFISGAVHVTFSF